VGHLVGGVDGVGFEDDCQRTLRELAGERPVGGRGVGPQTLKPCALKTDRLALPAPDVRRYVKLSRGTRLSGVCDTLCV